MNASQGTAMHQRAKIMTVLATMALTFVLLPTFGAAAAEPLDDGSYEIPVAGVVYELDVVDGTPVVDDVEGVTWDFAFDDDGRVLDEFTVTADTVVYEVEIAESGAVAVRAVETEVPLADESEEPVVDPTEVPTTEPTEEPASEPTEEELVDEGEGDEEADEPNHGEIVSTVAQCTPSGKVAREAGFPNHGTVVRAAAQGQELSIEVNGEAVTADLTTLEGAEAWCAQAADLLAAAEEAAAEEAAATEDEPKGNGNGKKAETNDDAGDADTTEAEAPSRGNGKSNEAPGRAKKGD